MFCFDQKLTMAVFVYNRASVKKDKGMAKLVVVLTLPDKRIRLGKQVKNFRAILEISHLCVK